MSKKAKTTRTQITDLPASVSELSAAELDHVTGGMLRIAGGSGVASSPVLRACPTCVPGSCTQCDDVDYISD